MESLDQTPSESGVNSVESTSGSESPSPAETLQEGGQQEAAASVEKPTPFHEHPRFKELITQKNEYQQRLQQQEQLLLQMQAQMSEMQKAYSTPKQETNKPSYEQVLKRLEQIDPEFGQFQAQIAQEISSVPELKQQLAEFKEWKQEMERQSIRTQAESRISSLYEQYKVPENMRGFYRTQIENMAYNSPNASVKDLDAFFKSAHENITKFFDEFKRSERQSYVVDKKKDITPATQTGGTAPSSRGAENQALSTEDRIKLVAAELRRGKEKI